MISFNRRWMWFKCRDSWQKGSRCRNYRKNRLANIRDRYSRAKWR